jgi:PAS domain S-box-containing protein/putative nucleotidyltransferase with HDIG domain
VVTVKPFSEPEQGRSGKRMQRRRPTAEATTMRRESGLLQVRLADLLNAMPDASFVVDGSGRIVRTNSLAESMFGYGENELAGQPVDVLIPERFRAVHATRSADCLKQDRPRTMGAGLGLRGVRKDGSEFPIEITLRPLPTNERRFLVGAVRDVTESEERYRASFEQIAVGVVHSTADGRLMNVNAKFCEISGYSRTEALTLDITAMTAPDDIAASMQARLDILEGRCCDYERQQRLVRKGGAAIWTHITTSLVRSADGQPVQFISVINDISVQKRAEAERQEIELRFRQVTENIREVFWLTDVQKHEILYVSPAYEAIWGRRIHALESAPIDWLDAVHSEDRERVREATWSRQIAGTYDEKYRIVRPDGSVRWISDRAFPVRDASGRVVRIAGVAEDITESKYAADQLRESERRFSNLLESVELISLMLDTAGRVTYCNEYLLQLIGWTRDEVFGRSWLELCIPPECHEEVKRAFGSLWQAGPEALHRENEILTRSGERRLIRWNNTLLRSSSGEMIGTASIGEDITERKRTESALRESEERFRAMIEQSISGTCIIDAAQRFVYVNPRLAHVLGYESADPMVGQPVLEFVTPEDRVMVAQNIRDRILGQEQSVRYHFRAIRRDGSLVTLGAHGSAGYYGGIRVIIAMVQDVTELRRAEEEVERTVEKLRRAMQSTIEVVSTMAELRDPYTHGHEHRVGELATAIATEMGLVADLVEGVRVAGYLHDVGKIALPAEILSKPGRLSRVEFELVKQHAERGYEILKRVEFPWPVAEAAWQHHERLDGSGYPRGLRGDAIILEARILAVADTVEAMASHRPYRPSLGLRAALDEIESNRGTLYDSAVVDACLALFRRKSYRLPR